MASALTLKDHQARCVRRALSKLDGLNPSQTFIISMATGQGKTLTTQVLLNELLRLRNPKNFSLQAKGYYKAAIVATPQEQIEESFTLNEDKVVRRGLEANSSDYSSDQTLTLFRAFWGANAQVRNHLGKIPERFRKHVRGEVGDLPILLVSHMALALWSKDLSVLPASLKGIILVLDEAHKAGDDTKLGTFVSEWLKRGGTVIAATATYFRDSDSDIVLPEEAPTFSWTLAEAVDAQQAPKDLLVDFVRLKTKATTVDQLDGKKPTSSFDPGEIFEVWEEHGRPDAVFKVPSTEQARTLADYFVSQGVEGVLRAYGADGASKRETLQALSEERALLRKGYKAKKIKVVIACKRFDEGSDWPACSHLFHVGISYTFKLVMQLLGRTTRAKHQPPDEASPRIRGYPTKFLHKARLVFLVPQASNELWERYNKTHKDFVHLLAGFLHDFDTAAKYRAVLRGRLRDQLRPNRKGFNARETIYEEVLAAFGTDSMDVVAEVAAARAKAEQTLALQFDRPPTVAEVVAHVQQHESPEIAQNVMASLAQGFAHGDDRSFRILVTRLKKLMDSMEDKVVIMPKMTKSKAFTDLIAAEMRSIFEEIVKRHETEVITTKGKIFAYEAKITGRKAIDIAKEFQEGLKRKNAPNFTREKGHEALKRYCKQYGVSPKADEDAGPWFGHPAGMFTWAEVQYLYD